jgi:hypothetical protein
VLEGFDLLAYATIQQGTATYTFRTFYRLWVDNVYANYFLNKIITLHNPEQDGLRLQTALERQIVAQLGQLGWIDIQHFPDSLYLQAYCVYWWKSFAKGYVFEVTVFRHLHQSGVRFWAHDVTDPAERYMPYDLSLSGWRGDVRTSTYFLKTARTQPLPHAFYITRQWDSRRRKRVWVVIMQPDVWATIDGDTKLVTLSQTVKRFPAASQIHWRNRSLVVAEYAVWLAKIVTYQETYDE